MELCCLFFFLFLLSEFLTSIVWDKLPYKGHLDKLVVQVFFNGIYTNQIIWVRLKIEYEMTF